MPSSTFWRRIAAGAFFCASLVGWPAQARAWYFPEHVVIAHDALNELGPDVRDVLARAVRVVRADGLAVCEAVDASLEQVHLPGRVDRSLAEINVGISEALHYDSYGRAGGAPHVTMLDEEVRWPVIWELLTSYLLPLDLGRGHDAGSIVLLSGVRVHELITTPAPVFWGIEAEALGVALSRGSGVYPLYTTSPELRVYVGAADPTRAQPSFPRAWAPTLGVAITGGYATFL